VDVVDFLHAGFSEPVELPAEEIEGPKRLYNRELSWLGFNMRVLEEAENPRVPLLERLRFLSISATNLDEFYTVRVAGLRELKREGNTTPAQDGLTPSQQLKLIDADARDLMDRQQSAWRDLRAEMEENNLTIYDRASLTEEDEDYLADVFLNQVFAVLSPLAIDPAHPFPFIPNTGFSLALQLERSRDGKILHALLPIPAQVPRFTRLPSEPDQFRYIPLEELLLLHLNQLFPGYRLKGHCTFRVLRDSDLEVEEEAEDLVREFESALKRRRRGEVIRMKVSAGAPKNLLDIIMRELHLSDEEVIEVDGVIGVSDLKELVIDDLPHLLWPSFTPAFPNA
jgi:polyphosphate kinase